MSHIASALNHHLHFHCYLIDGVFAAADEGMRFYDASALGDTEVGELRELTRQRVRSLFERRAPARSTSRRPAKRS